MIREMTAYRDLAKYDDNAWLATQCRKMGPAETKVFFDKCRAGIESMPEPQRTKEYASLSNRTNSRRSSSKAKR